MPRASATLSGGFSGRFQILITLFPAVSRQRIETSVRADPYEQQYAWISPDSEPKSQSALGSRARSAEAPCCWIMTAIMNRYFEHRDRAPNLAGSRLGAGNHAI